MQHPVFLPGDHKIIIYQLLVRLFGNTNNRNKPFGTIEENGCGKFNDINRNALNSLRQLGITHIWFTGVIEHSSVTSYPEYGIAGDDPRIVKGRAGSPYAVRDYYDVSPDLADNIPERMQEFQSLVNRTHDAGLKVLIDFIPNHLARSYHSDNLPEGAANFGDADDESKLFSSDNNFLYLKNKFIIPADYKPLGNEPLSNYNTSYSENPARVTGNDVYSAHPGIDDWFETVKLNFGVDPEPPHNLIFDPVPRTWKMLLDILLFWSKKGVDGFRCDMVEMVPAEFWEWVIPCVKTHHPDILFIGEIYKPELYERYLEKGNFDYLYDKVGLFDTLTGVLKGNTSADNLTNAVRSVEKFPERMLGFLENHDEERLGYYLKDPAYALPAMAVCAFISRGPVMIYNGQETGEKADIDTGFGGTRGRTSIFDYASIPSLQQWINKGTFDGLAGKLRDEYSHILNLCNSSDAIRNGKFYELQYCNRYNQSEGYNEQFIYAFLRYSNKERLLILANFHKDILFDVYVKIPYDAWKLLQMGHRKEVTFRSTFSGFQGRYKIPDSDYFADKKSGLHIQAPPSSFHVFSLE